MFLTICDDFSVKLVDEIVVTIRPFANLISVDFGFVELQSFHALTNGRFTLHREVFRGGNMDRKVRSDI